MRVAPGPHILYIVIACMYHMEDSSPLFLRERRSPVLQTPPRDLCRMVTLVNWKAMMYTGQDPREGTFPSLGLIVVSWLLAVTNSITFHVFLSTASREFVVVRGCTIMHIVTKYFLFDT